MKGSAWWLSLMLLFSAELVASACPLEEGQLLELSAVHGLSCARVASWPEGLVRSALVSTGAAGGCDRAFRAPLLSLLECDASAEGEALLLSLARGEVPGFEEADRVWAAAELLRRGAVPLAVVLGAGVCADGRCGRGLQGLLRGELSRRLGSEGALWWLRWSAPWLRFDP